jgi:DNA replication and repair protein RecF
MVLQTLQLHNFRNHEATSLEFGQGINALLGENGEGKTNILEAISFLCLTKSFYASGDALVVRIGAPQFEIDGTMSLAGGAVLNVRVAYSAGTHEKVFSINKRRVEPFSSVIGKFPIVVCSPEHGPITSGGPSERRRFMDFVVSQSNALYFQELLEYRKILKHRSKILSDARVSRSDVEETLAPWDEQLIIHGSAITLKRQAFVNEFQDFISSAYHQLVGSGEEPGMAYEPSVELGAGETEADHREKFRAELGAHRTEEVRLGSTLYGPHRDELALRINGLDLRKYASQGQHKTFLVALKIGEFFYLRDRCSEPPILLLDDIFSELDGQRADQLLRFTGELSQTFITSTNAHLFDAVSTSRGEPKRFTIHEGAVIEDHAAVTR